MFLIKPTKKNKIMFTNFMAKNSWVGRVKNISITFVESCLVCSDIFQSDLALWLPHYVSLAFICLFWLRNFCCFSSSWCHGLVIVALPRLLIHFFIMQTCLRQTSPMCNQEGSLAYYILQYLRVVQTCGGCWWVRAEGRGFGGGGCNFLMF